MIETILNSYWNIQILDVELLVTALSFLVTAFVGVSVYFNNPRSWTNIFFLLLAVVFDAYIIVNYFSLHPPIATPESRLYWIRLVMFTASFKSPMLFLFAHTFPGKKIALTRGYVMGTLALMALTAAVCLSPLVFQSITIVNNAPTPIPGPGIALFILNFAGFFILSIAVLIKKYRSAIGEERLRQSILLTAILASFSLYGIVILASVVVFHVSSFVFLAPMFLAILMIPIGYTIVIYNLFNIKVIATNMLIVVLWIVLFSKVIVSKTSLDTITNGIIFALAVIFGVLLIRGVRQEVRQREEIEKLAEELQETNERQEGLIHFIGHEVKGFLTKDEGAFASLSEDDFGELPETLRPLVEHALVESRQGAASVATILKAANLKKGTVTYTKEPFDLKALVAGAVEKEKLPAKHKGLELSFTADDASYQMTGDKAQITDHVLRNLIENSINYTPSGSIAVSLKKEDGKLVFSVKDTGIGITDEDKKRLFTEGGHGKDSQKVNVHSTGYGLYIAKCIIEAHGGTVRAESEGAGKGATFVVELPTE